ncbi:NAD(P)/FAD-dependent oxidoreductase [Roseibium sp. SCP14]|uniref:NAD(P)/FAD-dependent oxidoreductase n=1 Tax=Roseibium sp. SCP14 TaxID=3141375 RepID=UPI003337A355
MRVVVIGGGQAGASVASKLRNLGFEGDILLFTDESEPPYERPPLSKKHLLQDAADTPVSILAAGFWQENQVDLRLETKVDAIDPVKCSVLVGPDRFPYDHLVLATGSSARRLPVEGARDRKNMFHLRSLADANALRAELKPGKSMVLIGGGYIGMELAATAKMRGLETTVIERDERILNRVASAALSNRIAEWHRGQGVSVFEAVKSVCLSGETACGVVQLSNGTDIPADIIVAGIGAVPNTGLAEAAGLFLDNGIAVDSFGRTSQPNIWAAGDCASFVFDGLRIRLESVQNAIDQAETVAQNIVGASMEYVPTPTFWSAQFDHLIQMVGLYDSDMETVCRRATSGTSYWHYRSGILKAVEVIDDPKTFSIARRLLSDGMSPSPELVASVDRNLKEILKAAREPAAA